MLGCFVGPAGVAASGVPERFLDTSAIGKAAKPTTEESTSSSKNAQTEPMEIDQ